jgi:hypothetical protein
VEKDETVPFNFALELEGLMDQWSFNALNIYMESYMACKGNVSWPTGFASIPSQRGGINTNWETMALQNLTTLDLL